ncbi:ATP-binding response regulator [Alkalitalea saponilacus]|uniref:PAS fold n=1 Tax=Alkalitalea saponilacus TaxID=889453 RepID=A0A1T5HR38_9BACT|nr:response regulator [Alkalitalea saponilacus]ASB48383.1 response regulator [Alkalitalea saponilacus]SKC23164.1 PAS fold [Alkalitalea saponilacus]
MRKVLIVEDDKFLAAIFSLFIKDLGHLLVGRCQTGAQALEMCQSEKPDVVLMDIHLEGELDGIETAERIQRDFEIPVIFVTSDTSSQVVERAIVANSYGYLVKPVQKNELSITIDLAYYKHKAVIDQKRREQSFRRYLAEAPVAVIIVHDGRIQYLNMNALDLFHTHYIEDMIGLPLVDFVDDCSKGAFNEFISNNAGTGRVAERHDIVFMGLHKKPLDVAITGSWIEFNGKQALQIVMMDITPEKSAIRDCEKLRYALFMGGKGVMILDQNLKVSGVTPGFKSLIRLEQGSDIKDLNMDERLLMSLLNGNFEEQQETTITYLNKNYKCMVFAIGQTQKKTRELIVKIVE